MTGRFGDGSLRVAGGVPLTPDSPEGVISHPAIFYLYLLHGEQAPEVDGSA